MYEGSAGLLPVVAANVLLGDGGAYVLLLLLLSKPACCSAAAAAAACAAVSSIAVTLTPVTMLTPSALNACNRQATQSGDKLLKQWDCDTGLV